MISFDLFKDARHCISVEFSFRACYPYDRTSQLLDLEVRCPQKLSRCLVDSKFGTVVIEIRSSQFHNLWSTCPKKHEYYNYTPIPCYSAEIIL